VAVLIIARSPSGSELDALESYGVGYHDVIMAAFTIHVFTLFCFFLRHEPVFDEVGYGCGIAQWAAVTEASTDGLAVFFMDFGLLWMTAIIAVITTDAICKIGVVEIAADISKAVYFHANGGF
jgi:hypothetical protein